MLAKVKDGSDAGFNGETGSALILDKETLTLSRRQVGTLGNRGHIASNSLRQMIIVLEMKWPFFGREVLVHDTK